MDLNIILDGEKAKRQKLTIIYLKSIAMATYYIGHLNLKNRLVKKMRGNLREPNESRKSLNFCGSLEN